MNPTSCLFGSCLLIGWLAHFYLMKKSAEVLLYFDLYSGMMEFFTYEPQSKEQLISFLHFWRTVRRKRSRMQTVIRTSRRIRGLFAWSGSELWSCFKYSELNLKNLKTIAVDVHFNAYPMVPLSCRSIWLDGTFKWSLAFCILHGVVSQWPLFPFRWWSW